MEDTSLLANTDVGIHKYNNEKMITEKGEPQRSLILDNKHTNNDHDLNEDSARLLGGNQKKIIIVPSSTNKLATNGVGGAGSYNTSDNNVSIRPNGTRIEEFNKLNNNNVAVLRSNLTRQPAGNDEVHSLGNLALRTKQPLPMTMTSLRSLKSVMMEDANNHHHQHHHQMMTQAIPSWRESLYYSDAVSVRSLASVGMGSTDGKKVTIRRVPTSPSELFNIVNPHGLSS